MKTAILVYIAFIIGVVVGFVIGGMPARQSIEICICEAS